MPESQSDKLCGCNKLLLHSDTLSLDCYSFSGFYVSALFLAHLLKMLSYHTSCTFIINGEIPYLLYFSDKRQDDLSPTLLM